MSRDLVQWAYGRGVTLDFSRRDKLIDNAFVEAFNGRFRPEGMNDQCFVSLVDACEKMEIWCEYGTEGRPMKRSAKDADYITEPRWRN